MHRPFLYQRTELGLLYLLLGGVPLGLELCSLGLPQACSVLSSRLPGLLWVHTGVLNLRLSSVPPLLGASALICFITRVSDALTSRSSSLHTHCYGPVDIILVLVFRY